MPSFTPIQYAGRFSAYGITDDAPKTLFIVARSPSDFSNMWGEINPSLDRQALLPNISRNVPGFPAPRVPAGMMAIGIATSRAPYFGYTIMSASVEVELEGEKTVAYRVIKWADMTEKLPDDTATNPGDKFSPWVIGLVPGDGLPVVFLGYRRLISLVRTTQDGVSSRAFPMETFAPHPHFPLTILSSGSCERRAPLPA